jgi:hypothetical protein
MQRNFQCVQFITDRSCSWQVPCRDYTNSCLKQISNVYYVIKLLETSLLSHICVGSLKRGCIAEVISTTEVHESEKRSHQAILKERLYIY